MISGFVRPFRASFDGLSPSWASRLADPGDRGTGRAGWRLRCGNNSGKCDTQRGASEIHSSVPNSREIIRLFAEK